jgi:hypothetical protein
VVYGSLAGEGHLVKEYFWAGPYKYMKDAFKEAQELKISHQGDDSFVVRGYK